MSVLHSERVKNNIAGIVFGASWIIKCLRFLWSKN